MIVVIGGGASGMLSAITAAKHGARVLILEKKEQLGKKLSVTGNGRCNLLNSDRSLVHFHGEDEEKINDILNQISNTEILEEFAHLGILCRCRDGLYYPLSNKAQTVVSILNEWIKQLGITVRLNQTVSNVSWNGKIWNIVTDSGIINAEKVIVATGTPAGLSSKEKYNGISFLNGLRLDKSQFRPALTALTSRDKVCKYWQGVRCESNISLINNDNIVRTEDGELMLAEDGISGIAAFQLSHYIEEGSVVSIDFVPELSEDEIRKYFSVNKIAFENRGLSECLEAFVPAKLAQTLVTELTFREKVYHGRKAFEIKGPCSIEEISAISKLLKNFIVNISGTRGYSDSQVCRGGISLSEIDHNMEAVYYPGLFFTGEILDAAGDCGGFNLTWAWVTALLAGRAAAKEGK